MAEAGQAFGLARAASGINQYIFNNTAGYTVFNCIHENTKQPAKLHVKRNVSDLCFRISRPGLAHV